MRKRSLYVVAICVSFCLGVWGAGRLLAAGPLFTSCQASGSVTCPVWSCTLSLTGGGSATCMTCDGTMKTNFCTKSLVGECGSSVLLCCAQWGTCSGVYVVLGSYFDCSCGVANYPGNNKLKTPYCHRKLSIWTLFASW